MIPDYIKSQILEGRTVLFLGAGASIPSESKDKQYKGLSGNDLRDQLCDNFYEGQGKNKPLSYIASVCIDRFGQLEVHRFVKKLVNTLEPTNAHKLIPEISWKCIVTTNYDEVIEKAYQMHAKPKQIIEKVIGDNDDYQGAVADVQKVPLLKIHGCISRINDNNLNLVLSDENYHSYLEGRTGIFQNLKELATTTTVIFYGYSLSDANVKSLIFDLADKKIKRPKFILLNKYLDEMDKSYWSSNNFECFSLDLEEFINEILLYTPKRLIELGAAFSKDSSIISKLIPSHQKPTKELEVYLSEQLKYIKNTDTLDEVSPEFFYKGNSKGVGWLNKNYDFERSVHSTLLNDIFFNDSINNKCEVYFNIISGYAGSGKTIALKRLAWDASTEYDKYPVFVLEEGGLLKINEIIELSRIIQDRIYIFVDDCLSVKEDLKNLIVYAKREKLKITFISTVRENEWNDEGADLEKLRPSIYKLRDLKIDEIKRLIDKLKKYNLLGTLKDKDLSEQIGYLKNHLSQQLLVALHEITEGKNFEQILWDEYENIQNRLAKTLYLDICTLHKLNVNVRAGLVSRLSGVTFEDFRNSFMSPLESVIISYFNHRVGDYAYKTRHPHIAEIVFNYAFPNPSEKKQQLIKILRYLNVSFDVDKKAMQSILKGKALANDFTDKDLVFSIFNVALEIGIDENFIYHQMAVFEFHHPNGDLNNSLKFVAKIEDNYSVESKLIPKSVLHTKANILRKLASQTQNVRQKRSLRNQSLSILNKSTKNSKDSMPFVTKGYLLIDELNDLNSIGENQDFKVDRVFVDIVKDFELNLKEAYSKFPNHPEILLLESRYSECIDNSPRSLEALQTAYRLNKDNLYTVIRYTRNKLKDGKTDDALKVIGEYLKNHPTSKEANYEIASIYLSLGQKNNSELISKYLRKSFSTGDANFNARFEYARHEFIYGDVEKSLIEFEELFNSSVPSSIKNKLQKPILDERENPCVYQGFIFSLHDSFGFVRSESFPCNFYVSFDAMDNENDWDELSVNDQVYFSLAFTFRGPRIVKLSRLDCIFNSSV